MQWQFCPDPLVICMWLVEPQLCVWKLFEGLRFSCYQFLSSMLLVLIFSLRSPMTEQLGNDGLMLMAPTASYDFLASVFEALFSSVKLTASDLSLAYRVCCGKFSPFLISSPIVRQPVALKYFRAQGLSSTHAMALFTSVCICSWFDYANFACKFTCTCVAVLGHILLTKTYSSYCVSRTGLLETIPTARYRSDMYGSRFDVLLI